MESEKETECTELSKSSPPIFLKGSQFPNWTSPKRIPLFTSKALSDRAGIAYAGGRISVLKWHPQVKGIFATAAYRSDNPVHEVLESYSGTAHIQLWSVRDNEAVCLGVVSHVGDCVWDLKWRPTRKESESASGWCGTFAAALGNGCILICRFNDISSDSNGFNANSGRIRVLTCSQVILRTNKGTSSQKPVRVVQWSLDGKRLLVGCVNGSVEVFESSSSESVWAMWSVPAQESIVTDIRWVNQYLFCCLGTACVLRLRDIRDPIATIEQNAEGLAGSLSMCMAEPNVAVVGADTGYLRVVRLCGTDNFKAKYPVRRVYLQGNSFRTMQSVSAPQNGVPRSLVFTGGDEGILHEITFHRPLWVGYELCKILKTKVKQLLKWSVEENSRSKTDTSAALVLTIGSSTIDRVDDSEDQTANETRKSSQSGQKSADNPRIRKVCGPSGEEKPLFGDTYSQAVCITQVDVDIRDRNIVVGIDGGIITWMPLEYEFLESPLVETSPPSLTMRRRATNKSKDAKLEQNSYANDTLEAPENEENDAPVSEEEIPSKRE